MKNKILFALSFCLVATVSFGQDLVRFKNHNSLYGYNDPSKGLKGQLKPAIKAKYYEAEADGFKGCNTAIVAINPKDAACCEKVTVGVIDKTGAAIIPIEYKAAFRHKNSGYIMMRKEADDKRGLIHKDGKIIFPAEYKVMTLIGNDDWLADSHPTMLMFGKDSKYGLMELSTEKMTPMHFEQIMSNGYTQSYAVKLNGKWAFINNNFEEITPYKYTNMGWSNDNYSFWCEIDGSRKLIDAVTGKEGSIYTGEKPKEYSGGTNNNTSKPSTSSNSSPKKDKCTYKCRECNKVVEYSCTTQPGDDCPVRTQKAASAGGGRKGHNWFKQ
jgi:hypothetical protein